MTGQPLTPSNKKTSHWTWKIKIKHKLN
jgi:hypothetical protein